MEPAPERREPEMSGGQPDSQICVLESADAGGKRVVMEVGAEEPTLRVDQKRESKGQ